MQGLDFGKAHAVRRIGDDDAAFAVRACVLCIQRVNVNETVHFGGSGVGLGHARHGAVVVGRGDVGIWPVSDGMACFGFEFHPQGAVELRQLFKAETAVQPGCAAKRNPCGFNGDGAAAAKRVLEGLRAVVARQKQQAGGQIFAQGRFAGVLAVAAFEQGFAAGVDEDGDVALVQKGVDADVGARFVDAGALAAVFAEAVAHAVFDFQGGEVEAFHIGAFAFHFHFEGLGNVEPFVPRDVFGGLVDVVFAAVGGARQLQQNAAGGARVQVGAVNVCHRALAGNAAVGGGDGGAALLLQFLRQNGFQAARAGGE